MTTYEHQPHPRIAERALEGPTRVRDQRLHGTGPLARFNQRFGIGVTLAVGTMWCAYLFALLALVSLPSAIHRHDIVILVAWIAQTFLQLVLLPIIIVGQNAQAAAADKRAEATYKDAEAVLHEAIEIQRHLKAQDAVLERLIAAVKPAT